VLRRVVIVAVKGSRAGAEALKKGELKKEREEKRLYCFSRVA